MQSYLLHVLALAAAASARSMLGLSRRQDSTAHGPGTLRLIEPTNPTNAAYLTCADLTISWVFNGDVTDTFDVYITNIGIEYPSTDTLTTTSTTTSTVSIPSGLVSSTGPRGFLFRREQNPIDKLVFSNLHADASDLSRVWQAAVPAGWYKFHALSQTPNSGTSFVSSGQFRIVQNDTSCIPGMTGAPSSSVGQPQNTSIATNPPPGTTSSGPQPGVVAGAVVGSLILLAAVGGICLLLLRRRKAHPTPRPAAAAWGHVNSKESRPSGAGGLGLPPGTPNRLSRNAEAMVAGVPDIDQDSFEEKSQRGAQSPSFSPEPPIFRRHSQTSQAFILGPVSTRDSRRSTIQSIPSNVTPTNTTPAASPYPSSDTYASSETVTVSAVAPSLARSNSTAKKLARKPVPAYNPHSSTLPSNGTSEDGHDGADLGAQIISESQRSDSMLMHGFPFELEGAREVHYLIPDPPAPPRQ